MFSLVCCLVIITSRTFILLCTPCGQWTRPICSPFPMLFGAQLTVYLVLVYTNIYWSGHNFCLWCVPDVHLIRLQSILWYSEALVGDAGQLIWFLAKIGAQGGTKCLCLSVCHPVTKYSYFIFLAEISSSQSVLVSILSELLKLPLVIGKYCRSASVRHRVKYNWKWISISRCLSWFVNRK